MRLRLAFAGLIALGLSATLPGAPPVAPAPQPKPATKRDRVAELVEKLNAPVEDPIQPNGMTVKEYLAKLAKAHGAEIVLDEEMFRAAGVLTPAETKLSFQAPSGIRFHSLLKRVCFALGPGEGTPPPHMRIGVLIHEGRLIVTTVSDALKQQGLDPVGLGEDPDWTLLSTAWVIANEEPLSRVLRRVADDYGVNIVVSSAAAKLAETRITTRLVNVPLDSALAALADQGGLAVFVRQNVILVTLAEKAKELRQAATRLKAEREARFEADNREWLAGRFGFSSVPPSVKLVTASPDDKVQVDAANVRLRAVLADLTAAGFNVTLDPAVGDKVNDPVNLKLNNVSCEAAVKQLAELAKLRAVRMDNSLFVTTPEKADRLAAPAAATKKPPKKKKKSP